MNKALQFLCATAFGLFLLISFSSAVYLYEKREKISHFFKFKISDESSSASNYNSIAASRKLVADANKYWAKEIMSGGYILHFRHTERDKWIDVKTYDALESDLHGNGPNESRYAENDYFSGAVCLNERGKIQAKAIGESLKHIGLPLGAVHSSVSCRARQTADLAFDGYDQLHRALVHSGPYYEDGETRLNTLKELYASFAVESGTNIVVSSHNKVIECRMFINDKCKAPLKLEEGGFYVLRNTNDGLVFEHEFHRFSDFNLNFYER